MHGKDVADAHLWMNGQGFVAQLKETLGDATQNAEFIENAEHTMVACDEEYDNIKPLTDETYKFLSRAQMLEVRKHERAAVDKKYNTAMRRLLEEAVSLRPKRPELIPLDIAVSNLLSSFEPDEQYPVDIHEEIFGNAMGAADSDHALCIGMLSLGALTTETVRAFRKAARITSVADLRVFLNDTQAQQRGEAALQEAPVYVAPPAGGTRGAKRARGM